MDEEARWKRRFLVFALARLAGLAIFFLGIAIAYTGLAREGGWPELGAIVAVLGLIVSVVAPRILKNRWKREDSG